MIDKRIIQPAHGKRQELKGRQNLQWYELGKDPPKFTHRQLEVLLRVAQGFSDKEIAAELGLTKNSVQAHLKAIYRKLGVHTRTEAAITAYRAGIIHQSGSFYKDALLALQKKVQALAVEIGQIAEEVGTYMEK